MFPSVDETIQQNTENKSSGTKSYLFDFAKGDFVVQDGKLVACDGIEAIRVWIEKIIRTEKGRFLIYDDTEYGCHLEDLIIGNSYTVEFIESELKREIEEALLQNPQISAVGNFKITRGVNNLTVQMEVFLNGTGANSITVTV